MTSFDPDGGRKTSEEWRAIAFRKTLDNSAQWKVLGGFALGGVVGAMVAPAAGIALAGWAVMNAISGIKKDSRNRFLVRDYGCVAHLLSDEEFSDYSRQVILDGGSEQLAAELNFALSHDLDISDAAYDFLELRHPQALQITAAIPASATDIKLIPSTVATDSELHQKDYSIDIVSEIASPVRNCIIFGIGGSGKGMLLANAIRKIKSVEPSRSIFYIDPKAEEGEFGYTDGVCDVVKRKKCKGVSSAEIVEWLSECLQTYKEWAKTQEAPTLIVDEGTIIGGACKKEKNTEVGEMILHISSLGGASFEKIWLLAQSPYVGSMGLDLSSTSQITPVVLLSDDNTSVLKQWGKSSLMEKLSLEELQVLFDNCPIPNKKRAIFWGGDSKWYSMPLLHNYSDIDRDGNKPAGDALTTPQRESLRAATVAVEISKSQKLINQLERTKLSLIDFIQSSNQKVEQVLPILINLMREEKRNDLLENFGYGWIMIPDPIEAIKFWSKTNDTTDELLKFNWFLHTGKQLDDAGLKVLKEKLNGI
ncbi:MAG: hypothetical protein WBF90_33940 [Rivularia sp. (in: cyanobacteria)]